MKKIHLILNAHIDPIWLWPWEAGLDELLATCRSACDRLDAHPDIIFTRGEAWVYRQIELVDPCLFKRIARHIEAGRWEIVGGGWIQPDCNQPSGWAMEKQIEIGLRYFESTFGKTSRVGYNVDSFGHAATLPGYMQAAGQDRYIMMRPGQHEMDLTYSLFRWRGYENGPEVVTFRLPSAYTTRSMNLDHFKACVERLPEGIEHTMAFVGVGDHGGGPTEGQIAWCRKHAWDVEGWEMVFSSPSKFFDAIQNKIDTLPLVVGELQQHAIGCYSVYRPVKTHLRRAEHLMVQAEVATADPAALPCSAEHLKEPWEEVCFHAFHDTLGGTCLPSAYVSVADELGHAAAVASKTIALTLRRKMNSYSDDILQRMVFWNPNKFPFKGYVEFEPWMEGFTLGEGSGLLDAAGRVVPHQFIEQEAATLDLQRLLFYTELEAGEMKAFKILREGVEGVKHGVAAGQSSLANDAGATLGNDWMNFGPSLRIARPELHLIHDDSDTWSHNIDRYSSEIVGLVTWKSCRLTDSGPLMASWIEQGVIGDASAVTAEWRVYAGEPFIGLDLQIDYREKHRLLKLSFPLGGMPQTREDGIMGGTLVRINDGRELPIRDFTRIGDLGIICPDVYACDATPERLRLTLLRSPLMAHHEPHPGEASASRGAYSDQGAHRFRFRFYGGADLTSSVLELSAMAITRPPVGADLTRGMQPEPQV